MSGLRRRQLVAAGLTGAVVIVVLLAALLGAVRARLDYHLLGCPDIAPQEGEVPAPKKICDDPTRSDDEGLVDLRTRINSYAASLSWVAAAGDTGDLVPHHLPIRAQIVPASGADKLTEGDLARRGRIVAKIISRGPYAHGINYGVNWVWVDYGPFRGWRVLVIPSDIRKPIAVLADTKVDYDSDTARTRVHQSSATIDIGRYRTTEAWDSSLADEVKNCKDNGKKACWVNSVDPSQKSGFQALLGGDTDGWVWVTNRGCVCIGSKCHS